VVGAESIEIDLEKREMKVGGRIIPEGELISIDGATGEVFIGKINTSKPSIEDNKELSKILEWVDERSRLEVWANADNPEDAKKSLESGAKGIGLCRTEHMFMEKDRLPIVRRMMLAAPEAIKGDGKAKEEFDLALSQLLPIQRKDFKGILRAMDGLPVVIRLLDAPLNEFLPDKDELLVDVTRMEEKNEVFSAELDAKRQLLDAVKALTETNPMMGSRGCRFGIAFPGIYEMQVRAIFEAACELKREGLNPRPKIMIPLVAYVNELQMVQDELAQTAQKVMDEQGIEIDYKFGTMIEVPRAALTADKIGELADFFSFGTNDLTQMTIGVSRDDAEEKFLVDYVKKKILTESPFQSIDVDGVGQLVEMGVKKGRTVKPDLEIGVCGEHGGDPKSIEFFDKVGLDYVSASPFRVPVARLAAAQAQIKKDYSTK
jgi:pyruvate,orthophosphate dikinase